MGYTGKQVIHPGQIEIVQNTFIPTQKQYNWATNLLQAFEEQQQSGKVDGKRFLEFLNNILFLGCL